MLIQGTELAESLDKIQLPADAVPVLREGAMLPEVYYKGIPHLVGTDGMIYPRVVNNERHAGFTTPGFKEEFPKPPPPNKNPSKK